MTLPAIVEDRRFPQLTPLQEAFAVEYVENGGRGEQAAIKAGYSKASARTLSSRNLTIPAICEAVMQLAMMKQASMVPSAMGVVHRLSTKARSEYVQLEASKDILSRAGLSAPQRVVVGGGVTITIDLGE